MNNKISTLDLYYSDQCSRRWKEEKLPTEESIDPTRELMKKVFLMRAIGRDAGWKFSGIASVWDQIYWQGKEVTQENMRESVQGILAARKLYKSLPNSSDLLTHSTSNLVSYLDSSLLLSSSGDFLLSYSNRFEVWVYLKSAPKEIRRSPLPILEHYLVHQKVRDAHKKPFYLVCYYSSTKRRQTIHFRVRDDRDYNECRKVVYNLADKIKKNIIYQSAGNHCKDCNIKC